jgi:hypothetical protein
VQSALTKAGVFKDLKTDLKKTTATFKVSADVDFKTKLDEIVAGGNTHVKGYEVETAAPAKGDGASLQNAGSMQFVSVNKTGDCCASKKACETGDSESSFVTVSTVVDDEEKKEEKKTKTVSLKLPNMT